MKSLALVSVALSALFAAQPAAAVATNVQIAVSHRDAVWLEPVSVTVTGTGCGNEIGEARLTFEGVSQVVKVNLFDFCEIVSPPIPTPFSLTKPLGLLTPAFYRVQAVSPGRPEIEVFAETTLTVHPQADLGAVREYRNGLGETPSLVADTSAFDTCP